MNKTAALGLFVGLCLCGTRSALAESVVTSPSCIGVLELTPAPAFPESGKVLGDIAAKKLRTNGAQVVERRDTTAFLQARRLALPKQRDVSTVSAIGQLLQTSAVLDGMVIEYSDGTSQSERPGTVSVEVLLRLVDSASRSVLWEGSGRATGESMFRFQRVPMAEVSERAVTRALDSLAWKGRGAGQCPELASPALLDGGRTVTGLDGRKVPVDLQPRVLHFDAGETDLGAEAGVVIQEVATILRDNPDLRVVIVSHSDEERTAEETVVRALKRAEGATLELWRLGVRENRILLEVWGSRAPVAPNDSEFNRTLNRRLEFRFLAGATY